MLQISNVSVSLGGHKVLDEISLDVPAPDCLAIVGNSGSGKTSLAKVICGEIFHSGKVLFYGDSGSAGVAYIPQEHSFKNLSNTTEFYYQQRFNATESDQSLVVSDLVAWDNKWVDLLHLRGLLLRPVLQLSNGENKRLQLARKLQNMPGLLVLDNPFLGLDVSGRLILEDILTALKEQGVQIILISAPGLLPAFVTHVAVLGAGKILFHDTHTKYKTDFQSIRGPIKPAEPLLLRSLKRGTTDSFEFAVRMNNVHIQYGNEVILDNINWTVKRGDCWSLSGPNGAGKSTLLSLINGDNPQAYANEIYLFDRKRGSGESIWDIKKNIGYVSPELHLFFDQGSSCREILASGFFDTIGLFRILSDEQKGAVNSWIEILNLGGCINRSLRTMSRGEQRLALLGRALIKSPPMLILDEPCQGLDSDQTCFFTELVNSICRESGTTLIYVSHYPQDIPACVNQYLRLEKGGIV